MKLHKVAATYCKGGKSQRAYFGSGLTLHTSSIIGSDFIREDINTCARDLQHTGGRIMIAGSFFFNIPKFLHTKTLSCLLPTDHHDEARVDVDAHHVDADYTGEYVVEQQPTKARTCRKCKTEFHSGNRLQIHLNSCRGKSKSNKQKMLTAPCSDSSDLISTKMHVDNLTNTLTDEDIEDTERGYR